MALTVYRYRRDKPLTDAQLVKLAGSGATNIDGAGGPVYDIQIDSAKLADLDEQLLSFGYTRIATSPVGTPSTTIRESGGTQLSLGAVADGQSLQRSGTSLIGVASSAFNLQDILLFDHFITNNVTSTQTGWSGWFVIGTGTGNNQTIIGEQGYPGIIRLTNGTSATAKSVIHMGDTTFRNILPGSTNTNPINFECLISPRTTVGTLDLLRLQMGLGSGWALANPNPLTDGIYFRLEPLLSNHIFGVVANTSTRSTQDMGVVGAVGTWYRLGFVYTPSGTPSVQFKLNGVNVGSPITTNIPNVLLGAGFRTDAVGGGAAGDLYVDYVLTTQVTNKET